MSIEKNIERIADALERLADAAENRAPQEQPKEEKTTRAERTERAPRGAAKDKPKDEKPARGRGRDTQKEEKAAKAVSLDDVRDALTRIRDEQPKFDGSDDVIEPTDILSRFGCKRVGELHQDDYSAVLDAVEDAIEKGIV